MSEFPGCGCPCCAMGEKYYESLVTEVKAANLRERKAFMAGLSINAGYQDAEQEWQQYRCKDDTDWRAVEIDKSYR